MRRFSFLTILLLLYGSALGVVLPDNSLFAPRRNVNGEDLYSDITRYYRAGGNDLSFSRRGLDWWQSQLLFSEPTWGDKTLSQPTTTYNARVAAQSGDYTFAADINIATLSQRGGWSFATNMSYRTGRNTFVEGAFTSDLYPELSISKRFDNRSDHYLSVDISSPWRMRGLQGLATEEAYALTSNRYYNPTWGLYDGEVRNSRVSRSFIPEVDIRYQQPLSSITTAAVTLQAKYGVRSLSRLGWYDAYNPLPDYYRKMPSYLNPQSEAYTLTTELWQNEDNTYTQIDWDRLERDNMISLNGEAHYSLEDAVQRVCDIDLGARFSTSLSQNVTLNYGVSHLRRNHQYYKEMRDLLGADYLLDIDQYATDGAQVSNHMQNDLRNPNRHIHEGDKFGYDYSILSEQLKIMGGIKYSTPRLMMALNLSGGNLKIHRHGDFEKERFRGSASYGDSAELSLADYMLSTEASYSIGAKKTLSLRGYIGTTPPLERNLFLDDESSNYTINSPTNEDIRSIMLGYRYSRKGLTIESALSATSTSNGTQVFGSYDDLVGEFCNVAVSGISTSTINAEVAAEVYLSHSVVLTSTLSLGEYKYSSCPNVKLYNSNDMTLVADSDAIAIDGCIIGNKPQVAITSGIRHYSNRGYILALNCSYAGSRYIAPSMVRRTERLIATSSDIDIYTQERLDDILDFELSAVKVFWVSTKGSKLTLTARIRNLLDQCNRLTYSREANRILSKSYYGVEYARYAQPSTYAYGAGREYYLSLKYTF